MQLVATSKLQKLRRHFSASDQFLPVWKQFFDRLCATLAEPKTLFGDNQTRQFFGWWLLLT